MNWKIIYEKETLLGPGSDQTQSIISTATGVVAQSQPWSERYRKANNRRGSDTESSNGVEAKTAVTAMWFRTKHRGSRFWLLFPSTFLLNLSEWRFCWAAQLLTCVEEQLGGWHQGKDESSKEVREVLAAAFINSYPAPTLLYFLPWYCSDFFADGLTLILLICIISASLSFLLYFIIQNTLLFCYCVCTQSHAFSAFCPKTASFLILKRREMNDTRKRTWIHTNCFQSNKKDKYRKI